MPGPWRVEYPLGYYDVATYGVARQQCDRTLVELGDRVGGIGSAAVSMAFRRDLKGGRRSAYLTAFPEKVEGIRVGRRADLLYFLQTANVGVADVVIETIDVIYENTRATPAVLGISLGEVGNGGTRG